MRPNSDLVNIIDWLELVKTKLPPAKKFNIADAVAFSWWDWCQDFKEVRNLTTQLAMLIEEIVAANESGKKFDPLKCFVLLNSEFPTGWQEVDPFTSFKIVTLDDFKVIYTIVPVIKRGEYMVSEVWSDTNGYKRALVSGTWKDILNYFKK